MMINTSRGGIVNKNDLFNFLTKIRILMQLWMYLIMNHIMESYLN